MKRYSVDKGHLMDPLPGQCEPPDWSTDVYLRAEVDEEIKQLRGERMKNKLWTITLWIFIVLSLGMSVYTLRQSVVRSRMFLDKYGFKNMREARSYLKEVTK